MNLILHLNNKGAPTLKIERPIVWRNWALKQVIYPPHKKI